MGLRALKSTMHTTGDNDDLGRLQLRGFVVAVCLCTLMALGLACGRGRLGHKVTLRLEEKINPNTASAGSLVRLPRIGLARAQAIVVYRRDVQERTGGEVAFHRPEDLMRIKGIGPKIVQDIAKWLEFDSPLAGGASDR